ncbi:hypothetical protein AMECASPLE_031629, partial [Ameca splendens]
MSSKQKGNGKQVVADQKMATNSLERRVPENHAATTAPVSVTPIEPGKKKSKTKENKRFMFYFVQGFSSKSTVKKTKKKPAASQK